MKKFLKILEFILPVFAVIVLELVLFKANYVPGTWLTGWDSTQPELNLSESLARNLGAIWQEYRGLGVLDGMAHAANLVHTFYIWALSLILPPNVIRYFFVFLMHGLGGIGAYFLVRFLLKGKNAALKTAASAIASIFYLFNPATIQMFYAPLELFIIHYGFLPWLILSLLRFLESGRKKDLLVLFLVNLLAVSQSHVPTIFIVYALFVAAILAFHLLGNFKSHTNSALVVLAIIFATNAFWGLPYIYSAYKNAQVITSSKINELSNPEIVLRNEAFGELKSVALLKGFSLDYEDWKGGSEFGYQMEAWRAWGNRGEVKLFGFLLFGLGVSGGIISLIKREKRPYPFIAIFIFSIVNLGARIPVISLVRNVIWNFIPYYEEVFRFAFTKFAIVYVLAFAVLLAFALAEIPWQRLNKALLPILVPILIAGVVWSNLPAAKGEFLYDKLKLEVPQEYFSLFDFLDRAENEGRVAILPQSTFWNWEYNRWGYRGSGFVWQGISSPTLHRSFDPWSSYNEGYYHEMADAIYRKDQNSFENVLKKYGIRWVITDASIFQPGGWEEGLYFEEAKNMLVSSNRVGKSKAFGGITIYETDFGGSGYLRELSSPVRVKDDYSYLRRDPNYFGRSYVSGNDGIWHPFAGLLSDRPTKAKVDGESVLWEAEIPEGSGTLSIPSWASYEDLVPVDLYATYSGGGQIKFRIKGLFPEVKVDGRVVTSASEGEFTIPLSGESKSLYLSFGDDSFYQIYSRESEQFVGALLLPFNEDIPLKIYKISDDVYFDLYTNFDGEEVRKCWQREGKEVEVRLELSDPEIRLSGRDATACLGAHLPMDFSQATLLSVTLEHMSATDTPPDTCLTKEGKAGCIGTSPFYQAGSSKDWGSVATFYELAPGGIYWLDLLSRAKDEVGKEASIKYKNVLARSYPQVAETGVRLEESFAPKTKSVSVGGAKRISLEVPLGEGLGLVKREEWSDNRGGEAAENCGIFGLGEVGKSGTFAGTVYSAKNKGINCDHFTYFGLRPNQGYLLRLKGENRGGRSLKFILNNNSTRHNDLEDLLPKGNFEETYTLLADTNPRGEYTLVLETRSFGSEESTNLVSNIEFIPAPIDWLANLTVGSKNGETLPGGVKIESSKKVGTFFYEAKTQGEGVIELAQAYEEGWIALSDGKILPHVKVDGWANGWIINECQMSNVNREASYSCQIVILYWPQYLEFAGFIVAIAALSILIFSNTRHIGVVE